MTPYLHVLHQPAYFGVEWRSQFVEFFYPFLILIALYLAGRALANLWKNARVFWE